MLSSGSAPFVYQGETYSTWYKVVGDPKSGHRPLVTLHGGPGMSHHYMLPHAQLHALYGVPVVFYDQIGIGRSTHLRDKPAEFWTMDLFMDELDNMLDRSGIRDDFNKLLCRGTSPRRGDEAHRRREQRRVHGAVGSWDRTVAGEATARCTGGN